ncbi:tail fiber domain-containing protein [Arenibacter aquaticus]|uniref:Tail fiber domain-containing protein n=1 Tax=Arenibacter aquaticus TaxID=2489054 RepID=A0A430K6W7_9FLAO|nr:tail fiber domain-containing protein [Arenibacter aquaticus]RTE54782.1 tail fiber domain-containing protein [Arenibacter aquaticus]
MATDIILQDREIEFYTNHFGVKRSKAANAHVKMVLSPRQQSVNLSLGDGANLSGNLLLGSTKISEKHGVITNKSVKCAKIYSNRADIGELNVCKGINENLRNGKAKIYGKPNKVAIMLDGEKERVGIGTSRPSYSLHVEGTVAGRGPFRSLSDGRCKTDVQQIQCSINTLKALRGVKFKWKENALTGSNPSKNQQWGFVAQEVESIIPDLISKDKQGRRSLSYSSIVPILVEGIKEQQLQLEAQTDRIAKLEHRLKAIEDMLYKTNIHA